MTNDAPSPSLRRASEADMAESEENLNDECSCSGGALLLVVAAVVDRGRVLPPNCKRDE